MVGIGAQAARFLQDMLLGFEAIYVLSFSIVAIACGVFLLRGQSWTRWLAVAWFAFHVVIGALHSWQSAVLHVTLLAIRTYALFCRQATIWFHSAKDARPS
ncbi:MAG: hypothetical protein JWM54_152 [Acidobacteriaceae bacterium]|nr:hypothetical protein [Acidobacteriaceae bacterium]